MGILLVDFCRQLFISPVSFYSLLPSIFTNYSGEGFLSSLNIWLSAYFRACQYILLYFMRLRMSLSSDVMSVLSIQIIRL